MQSSAFGSVQGQGFIPELNAPSIDSELFAAGAIDARRLCCFLSLHASTEAAEFTPGSKPSVFASTNFRIIKGLIAVVKTDISKLSPKLWNRPFPDVAFRLVIFEMGSRW